MNLLLDTHAFLWLLHGDERLSRRARRAFTAADNRLFLSAASYWEIAIKQSIGKLRLAANWQNLLEKSLELNRIQRVLIEPSHCHVVAELPFHHRDPFDRLLVAQAMVEKLSILTSDDSFSAYEVDTVW